MKRAAALLLAALAVVGCAEARTAGDTVKDVVGMLQGMLDKSKTDGLGERDLYAKYKCYCDDNEKTKTESVEQLTEDIEVLESEIDGLRGSNGALSMEVAELKKNMDENTAQQEAAQTMRDNENADFLKLEKDLKAAIKQMGDAIKTLSEIGADQSLGASREHEKFMANYNAGKSLVIIKDQLHKAMLAADSFLPEKERRQAKILLQNAAPFTGTYAAQSGEVVGILKNMKETFQANLDSATAAEAQQLEAHNKFMKNKGDAFTEMETAFDSKNGELGTNDGSLKTKTTSLKTAKQQKEDDEDFLSKLVPMCEKKAKEYEMRKMFRANEEAAIAKAISILNSDRSATTFSTVDAAGGSKKAKKAAAFVQLAAIRSHDQARDVRKEVVGDLTKAAKTVKSRRVARVASLLSISANPFTAVLAEIKKMKELIDKEAKQDKEHLDWCTEERRVNKKNLGDKEKAITNIEGDITQLENDIDSPKTGLKAMIKTKETDLETNRQTQTDETATRREENQQYQDSIANMVKAEDLISQAIAVLQQYYEELDNQQIGFVQKKADPAPPSTWSGDFEGQKSKGNSVISTLQFILDEAHSEQTQYHDDEASAQHAYEDSMETLTTDEKDLVDEIAELNKDLADAKEALEAKREDLDQTTRDKIAIERYLESIKPPCDFITDNYDDRETFRGEEKTALNTAISKIKGTPAFAKAKAEDKRRAQGECADTCEADEAHVDCKACLADVSVPGYCAGHPGTAGC